jgi:chromosomal replication initiation ATPase DnaA
MLKGNYFATLLHICETVSNYYQVPIVTLFKVKRCNANQLRSVAIYLAVEFYNKKFKDIANYFTNISESDIAQVVWRVKKLTAIKSLLVQEVGKLSKMIS